MALPKPILQEDVIEKPNDIEEKQKLFYQLIGRAIKKTPTKDDGGSEEE